MKRFGIVAALLLLIGLAGCNNREVPVVSRGGVKIAQASIQVGSDGLTVEQRNIKSRLEMDNKPGAIKHLYIISPLSGQCILYSSVKGKVTSSGKRLSPYTVTGRPANLSDGQLNGGPVVNVGNQQFHTTEVLQDDGTYGSSIDYIYWWDQRGVYHQHYVTSQIVHISTEPIPLRNVVINVESKEVQGHPAPQKDEGKKAQGEDKK